MNEWNEIICLLQYALSGSDSFSVSLRTRCDNPSYITKINTFLFGKLIFLFLSFSLFCAVFRFVVSNIVAACCWNCCCYSNRWLIECQLPNDRFISHFSTGCHRWGNVERLQWDFMLRNLQSFFWLFFSSFSISFAKEKLSTQREPIEITAT